MGASKARPYYRARRSFGRRIGAGTGASPAVSRLSAAGTHTYSVTTTQAIIPRAVASGSKFYSTTYGAAISASGSGTTGITTQIAAGLGEADRLGNEITLQYLDVIYTIANTNTNVGSQLNAWNTVRFMLCLDRATNGAAPGLSGYKSNVSEPVRAPWDSAFVPGALVPLMDVLHDYDATHRVITVRKRINLKGVKTTYNSTSGGTANSVANHLFFLFLADYDNNTTLFNALGCRMSVTLAFSD